MLQEGSLIKLISSSFLCGFAVTSGGLLSIYVAITIWECTNKKNDNTQGFY